MMHSGLKRNQFSLAIKVVFDYFIYFLLVDTENLVDNDFSQRYHEIKEGIISTLEKRYDSERGR
jgi:hypothetical protein